MFFYVILRDGDHYDALRDCLKALSLNPGHLKAHFRLARCLFELKYVAEALECLDDFKGKFPEQAHSSACDALDKDIKAALYSKSESGGKERNSSWLIFSNSQRIYTDLEKNIYITLHWIIAIIYNDCMLTKNLLCSTHVVSLCIF